MLLTATAKQYTMAGGADQAAPQSCSGRPSCTCAQQVRYARFDTGRRHIHSCRVASSTSTNLSRVIYTTPQRLTADSWQADARAHKHKRCQACLRERPNVAFTDLVATWAFQVVCVCMLRLVNGSIGPLDNKVKLELIGCCSGFFRHRNGACGPRPEAARCGHQIRGLPLYAQRQVKPMTPQR